MEKLIIFLPLLASIISGFFGKIIGNKASQLITSFFVQLLQIFNPLLIQQIIDAVISQGNLQSLNIYGILLIVFALSEGVLGSLRTFLFNDTTNRMDI